MLSALRHGARRLTTQTNTCKQLLVQEAQGLTVVKATSVVATSQGQGHANTFTSLAGKWQAQGPRHQSQCGHGPLCNCKNGEGPFAAYINNNNNRTYATVVDGLKYAESHEWCKLEGDSATIGITDFAQAELGDVVYVELPEVGTTIEAKETFGVVESVKAASDVYSPVSGEVVEINEALVDDPSKLNSEPFEGGWMMKIKVSDASEADALMDSDAYSKQCEE